MNTPEQIKKLIEILNNNPYETEEKSEILRNEISNFLFARPHKDPNATYQEPEDTMIAMIEKMHTEQFLQTYHMITEDKLPVTFYKQVTTKNKLGEKTITRVPKDKADLEQENEQLLLSQFESFLQMNRRNLIKREPSPFNPAGYAMAMALITSMIEMWKNDPKKYNNFYAMMTDYIRIVYLNTKKSEEYQETEHAVPKR